MTTAKFTLTLGRGVKGRAIRAIKEYCFTNDVQILQLDEDKGFITSLFLIRLQGDERTLMHLYRQIEAWGKE